MVSCGSVERDVGGGQRGLNRRRERPQAGKPPAGRAAADATPGRRCRAATLRPRTRERSFPGRPCRQPSGEDARSEEHTSELQSLMRISYAVFCLKKKKKRENDICNKTHMRCSIALTIQ